MNNANIRPGYSIYRRKDSRFLWMKVSHNGRELSESTKTDDPKKAERKAQQRLAELRTDTFITPQARRTRVEELMADLFTDYSINKARSLPDAKARWLLHLKPFFGPLLAVDVSTSLLKRYVDARHREQASNGSVNRELALVKRALHLGRESRKVRELPVFPRLKEAPPRKGFLENHHAIVNACPELWFRSMVECGRTYGWRVSELQGLRVRQVDLFERTIRLDAGETKNCEGRLAVMTEAVYLLLSECVRGKKLDEHVFTRANGRRVADFRVTWRKACVAAGVGNWICPRCEPKQILDAKGCCGGCRQTWKPRQWRYVGAIFHDWRRTAVRNMVRNGVPERVAMTISGHKTRSVFDRYNIVSEADLADAARKMEARNRYELATFELKGTPVANTRTLN